jgi:hypothetical protein
MPAKRASKIKPERPGEVPVVLRSMPAAEALSFLRDTRGLTTWTARDMADSLKINVADAKHVIAILELQGYVKPAESGGWMTTLSGEDVSGSKPPRYTCERVERALTELRRYISERDHDPSAPYEIIEAVAFGDFLSDRPRVQSAEVGIKLVQRGPDSAEANSAQEAKAQRMFLKRLQGKGGVVRVRPYEKWMSERTHRDLLP